MGQIRPEDLIGQIARPEFGILFLGLFVGALLGLGLSHSSKNLKAVLTAIGAALGGGPILFMEGALEAKWTYPLGLVIGLTWVRFITARKEISNKSVSGIRRVLAWLDMIVIIVITLAAAVYSFL